MPIVGGSLCQYLLGCVSSRFLCPKDRGTPSYNGLVCQGMFCTSWGQHQSVPCADDKAWIDRALLDALPQRLHPAHDVILGRSS